MLAALEGNLISLKLRVVSTGVTGRVVADRKLEGAAKLPLLERAIVLAKDAKVDCVFQLFRLDIGRADTTRIYSIGTRGQMVETPMRDLSNIDPNRRWTLTGPLWSISGKVIDVDSGDVLAIVNLTQSTVGALPETVFRLDYVDGSLTAGHGGTRGWRFSRTEDMDRLRTSMMSLLAAQIIGPMSAAGPTK